MSEDKRTEGEVIIPKDISSDIIKIIDDPEEGVVPRTFLIDDYLRGLRREPSLTLTMDWRGLAWARWTKAFLENGDALMRGQKRTATIRCTEQEKNEAANIFASGVKWINSEEEKVRD
jgi:hypothetical protein